MFAWFRMLTVVIASLAVAGAAAWAHTGYLIYIPFLAGGCCLHAIELEDPSALINRRRRAALEVNHEA